MTLKHAEVLARDDNSATVLVCGSDEDGAFAATTTIREGRDAPDCFIIQPGHGVTPATEDFAVRLHEALDEQTEITAAEMARICD